MKREFPLLTVVLIAGVAPLILLAGAVPSPAAAAGAPELLRNPMLEDKINLGRPDAWQPFPDGNNTTTFLSSGKDRDGNFVKIVDRDPRNGVGISQFVPCTPGHRYAFSVETKGGQVFLYLRFHDDQRRVIDPENRVGTPAHDEWRRHTVHAMAPKSAAWAEPWIYSASDTITDVQARAAHLVDEGTETPHGPLTTDKAFFDALNLNYPGLQPTRAAVEVGDLETAKKAYLEFRRKQSRIHWTLDYRPDRPAANTLYPIPMPEKVTAATDPTGDRLLQHQIGMPWGDTQPYNVGTPINWEFNPRQPMDPAFTREWTYIALNRMYFWILLSDAYWKTLDEKYAREWVNEMESWVRENPVPLDAAPGDTLTWRSIEAGIRTSEAWPYAYFHFLQSPSFTPEANLTFAKSMLEHGERLARVLADFPEHGGNWVTMESRGLGTIGFLYPELKQSNSFVNAAVGRLNRELVKQVYPDGGQIELSTSYAQVARENFVGLAQLATLNNAQLPPEYMTRLKAMYLWNQGLMDQQGVLPPVNDSDEYPVRVTRSLAEAASIWPEGPFRFGATAGKEGIAPPTSTFMPYSGYYAMRTGWKPDDLYLFFDAGPVGTGHWHEDMLNLYLRDFGQTLLTEAGGYAYDQSPMRRYVLSTQAHNTITVDGKEQHRGGENPNPPMTPVPSLWSSSPMLDYASGTYDAGYQETKYVAREYNPVDFVGPRDLSVSHTRHILFLKSGYVLVLDFVNGAGQHRADAYFHLDAPDAAVDMITKRVHTLRPDGVQLGLYPLSADGLEVRKALGQQDPLLGWVAWTHRPIPTIVYTRQGQAPLTFATLLYPYKGDAPVNSSNALPADSTAIWAREIDTPMEKLFVYLKRKPDTAPMDVTGVGVTAFSTDADVAVVQQPRGTNKSQIFLHNVREFRSPNLALTVDEPANLLVSMDATGGAFFNAGATELLLHESAPSTHTIRVAPGAWTLSLVNTTTMLSNPPTRP